jgi:hypothetical protein
MPYPDGSLPGLLLEVVDHLVKDDLLHLPTPGRGLGITPLFINGVQGLPLSLQRLDVILGHFGYLHSILLFSRPETGELLEDIQGLLQADPAVAVDIDGLDHAGDGRIHAG